MTQCNSNSNNNNSSSSLAIDWQLFPFWLQVNTEVKAIRHFHCNWMQLIPIFGFLSSQYPLGAWRNLHWLWLDVSMIKCALLELMLAAVVAAVAPGDEIVVAVVSESEIEMMEATDGRQSGHQIRNFHVWWWFHFPVIPPLFRLLHLLLHLHDEDDDDDHLLLLLLFFFFLCLFRWLLLLTVCSSG